LARIEPQRKAKPAAILSPRKLDLRGRSGCQPVTHMAGRRNAGDEFQPNVLVAVQHQLADQ
jgi:hypothetical protein